MGAELIAPMKKYREGKVLLIGGPNTINAENMKRCNQLPNTGGADVWPENGNAAGVPACGERRMDIAIASPS